jgi:Ala-tRNA(Pro) deacylase
VAFWEVPRSFRSTNHQIFTPPYFLAAGVVIGAALCFPTRLDAKPNTKGDLPMLQQNTVCDRLQELFTSAHAPFRLMEHQPAGPTDVASAIRGNRLQEAAKAMVLIAVKGKKEREYILAVVPGNRRINFKAVRTLSNSSYVGLAPAEKAEELTGCVMGSVPPFSFHPDLKLLVDRQLLNNAQIVFNAGRLDQSIFLSVHDFVAIAKPTIGNIAQEEPD